jgi:hypothetical protein
MITRSCSRCHASIPEASGGLWLKLKGAIVSDECARRNHIVVNADLCVDCTVALLHFLAMEKWVWVDDAEDKP